MLTFFQETEVQGFNKDVLLLLALYREVTLANASPVQQQTLSEEVSKASMSRRDKTLMELVVVSCMFLACFLHVYPSTWYPLSCALWFLFYKTQGMPDNDAITVQSFYSPMLIIGKTPYNNSNNNNIYFP